MNTPRPLGIEGSLTIACSGLQITIHGRGDEVEVDVSSLSWRELIGLGLNRHAVQRDLIRSVLKGMRVADLQVRIRRGSRTIGRIPPHADTTVMGRILGLPGFRLR